MSDPAHAPGASQSAELHRLQVVDQFSRQAAHFAQMTGAPDDLILAACDLRASDRVLDVACGPGLMACALAARARHVLAIDVTPAMIEQARSLQASRGLHNLDWLVAEVPPLPLADAGFSLVFCRYSFHHMLNPPAALAEMARVCAPSGRVVVVDVYTTSRTQSEAFNELERLRDPSHVRALGLDELVNLFTAAGLRDVQTLFYRHEMEREALLAASFPAPGDAERVRELLSADIGVDRLGIGARRDGVAVRFSYPVVILSGQKPAS